MIKNFLKNSTVYAFGSLCSRGIGIFLLPIYTRYLSPDEYGILDLFSVIGALVSLTVALEITQAIARYYQDSEDKMEKIKYTSTAFWFSLFVYCMYVIFSIIFSDKLAILLLDNDEYRNIFILASFAIATNGLFYFSQNQLKWQIQPIEFSVTSVINTLLIACVAIYLLVVQNLKVESIFIGQIIGNLISLSLAMYFARNSYRLTFDFIKLKEMLSFSFPLVLSGMAIFVAMYIDRIAIKGVLGLEELGVYGVAYRFAAVSGLVMIGFQSSLTPLIYKHYKKENTPMHIARIFAIFCLFALIVLTGSIFFSKEALIIFVTKPYYSAQHLIPILILATFFSNMYMFAPGLGIAKKTKIVASISMCSACLNGVLNYILIPIIGLYGAALATLLSSFIAISLHFKLSYQYYPIPYDSIVLIASFLVSVFGAYFVLSIIDPENYIFLLFKVLCFVLISIGLFFTLSKNIFGK